MDSKRLQIARRHGRLPRIPLVRYQSSCLDRTGLHTGVRFSGGGGNDVRVFLPYADWPGCRYERMDIVRRLDPNGGLHRLCVGPRRNDLRPDGRAAGRQGSLSDSWRFNAAAGTRITEYSTATCFRAPYGASGSRTTACSSRLRFPEPSAPSRCPPLAAQDLPTGANANNIHNRAGLSLGALRFVMYCIPNCLSDMTRASVEISSFRAEIADDITPSVHAVRGPLAANSTHVGVESVVFDVADAGVGVYRAVAEARINATGEWRELGAAAIGQSRVSCSTLKETAYRYEFDDPQPCPLGLEGRPHDGQRAAPARRRARTPSRGRGRRGQPGRT